MPTITNAQATQGTLLTDDDPSVDSVDSVEQYVTYFDPQGYEYVATLEDFILEEENNTHHVDDYDLYTFNTDTNRFTYQAVYFYREPFTGKWRADEAGVNCYVEDDKFYLYMLIRLHKYFGVTFTL